MQCLKSLSKYVIFYFVTIGSFVRYPTGNTMQTLLVSRIIIYDGNEKSMSNQLTGRWLSKRNQTMVFLFPCAVHGMWGSWTSWTACSKSCGHGTRERKRFCDNPKPAYNGTYCLGDGYQKENCSASHSCPSTLFYIPAQLLVSPRIWVATQWKHLWFVLSIACWRLVMIVNE